MYKLYENIGGKIKMLAIILCVIESIAAFVIGFELSIDNAIGILVMLLGPVVAWILSWMLYGFGEIIDKVGEIANNTRQGTNNSETQPNNITNHHHRQVPSFNSDKVTTLNKLLSQGLITEEEYQTTLKKYQ